MCILTKAVECIVSCVKWLSEKILACQREGNRCPGHSSAVAGMNLVNLVQTTSTDAVVETPTAKVGLCMGSYSGQQVPD